jgi:FAD/FMN-containing dehydrogenase
MFTEQQLSTFLDRTCITDAAPALGQFAKDLSFSNAIRPSWIVKPRDADDVKKIVALANRSNTPLIPVSSGPPHFRGDTVPSVAEAAIVDLTDMKRIIRVDRLNRVAMCEPGVTFGQLIPALREKGLRLNMPLLPRKTKSVVASMLEREPVLMPKYHWDISDPLACVEVVFGTGDVFRTGEAAGPGTLEEQWENGSAQKEAAGPSAFSLHRVIQGAQGTMGIVTWASMRCELLPKREEPFWVQSPELETLIDLAQSLIKLRLVNECLILNAPNLTRIVRCLWKERAPELTKYLAPWTLFVNIAAYDYFPELRVNGQVEDMSGVAQRLGIAPQKAIGPISAWDFLTAIQGPASEPYWKLADANDCQDIFFITTADCLSPLIDVMNSAAIAAGYPVSQIGTYIQPIVQGVNYHCEFSLPYDSSNRVETKKAESLTADATRLLMEHGAHFSRPYGSAASTIVNRDAGTVWALRKVKSILDPNAIMNPGKLCF